MDDSVAVKTAVIRLLSGTLKGCEYRLEAGSTLFVVRTEQALMPLGAVPEFPDNAIVIPSEGASCNFEVLIDSEDGESFTLRRLYDEGAEEVLCRYQTACDAGAVMFAVRRASDAWEDTAFAVRGPDEARGTAAPRKRGPGAMVVALVAIALAGAVALASVTLDDEQAAPVPDVASVIGGAPSDYAILPAQDGRVVHVFARTQRDAARARQALTRSGIAAGVEVRTLHDEEVRVRRLLLERMPGTAVHRVRLDDPARPTLVVSEERTSRASEVEAKLRDRLLGWMPYAKAVGIERLSDALVEQRAIAGIERIGATYERVASDAGVVLRIGGDLDDVGLAKLRRFIETFEKGFGAYYVSFVMDEKPEWMKGKSFKYGEGGYVKEERQHWYFDGELF
ncbi:hypothetical protein WJ81_15510 [Burkholderia ubonensis]|nr:hypothetical protein WJ81_15510 [Burkholderia ubonensis]